MCRELEAIGLPYPVFDNNTFILKTTVKSADRNQRKSQNAMIERKNARIDSENTSILGKGALIERLQQKTANGNISSKDAADIRMVIEDVDILQVVTSKEVMRILSCQTTKARLILKMMEAQSLIKTMQGKGKGKYILNVIN